MKILLIIILLFIIFKILEFIENNVIQKNIKKKDAFKQEIKDFSLKFLQPLIKDDEKYETYKLLSIDTIKIYIKLLQENFDSQYIDDDVAILSVKEDIENIKNNIGTSIEEKQKVLEEITTISKINTLLEKKWNFKDSFDFLNHLYFDCLFKKFIKEFSIDNSECVDDWDSIKNAYINTFANNMDYLVYIQEYIQKKEIYTPFNKTIEEMTNDIVNTIEKRAFNEKVEDYKNLMNSQEKIKKDYIDIKKIDIMTGIEFEEFLEDLFKKLNYKVSTTKTIGDQGADLILEKFGKKTVVQAKCYSNTVSNKSVQEAVAAISFYNAHNAIVVTNNYFTKSAIELANSNNVELWDRDYLIKQLNLVKIEIF